jgi:hypothetical protein
MGDEADGLFRARPERQKLLVQVVAHDLVERAERLVHQQDIGIEGQRAGDRGALLHAARQLPGELLAEPFDSSTSSSTPSRRARLLGPVKAHDLQRQRDVLSIVRHG